jgi:hypothetical protein
MKTSRPLSRVWRGARGSVVVFALVILAVSAIVLAGWVQVLGSQAEFSMAQVEGMQRRILQENSRAMAVQYIRSNMLAGVAIAGVTNTNVQWESTFIGGVAIPSFGASSPLSSTNQPLRWNPFSPAGTSWGTGYFIGFSANVTNARIYDGTNSYSTWTLQARSRASILGFDLGDLTAISTSPSRLSVASTAAVGTSVGPRTNGVLLNTAYPPQIPSGLTLPDPPSMSGVTTVTVNSGSLRMNDNNSDRNRRLWTGTNNNIATFYIYRREHNVSPAPIIYHITNSNTQEIRFDLTANQGNDYTVTDPQNAPPILVQCTSTYNSLRITVPSGNQRQIYLRINNTQPCEVILGGSTRLAAVFGGTSLLRFRTPSSSTITGGFQALSHSVEFKRDTGSTDRTLNIQRETSSLSSSQLLEYMAHRSGWVEVFAND